MTRLLSVLSFFAIHRFHSPRFSFFSKLQRFIRARNVIRTSSSPNLSQETRLLVMKLIVDCDTSSFLERL